MARVLTQQRQSGSPFHTHDSTTKGESGIGSEEFDFQWLIGREGLRQAASVAQSTNTSRLRQVRLDDCHGKRRRGKPLFRRRDQKKHMVGRFTLS